MIFKKNELIVNTIILDISEIINVISDRNYDNLLTRKIRYTALLGGAVHKILSDDVGYIVSSSYREYLNEPEVKILHDYLWSMMFDSFRNIFTNGEKIILEVLFINNNLHIITTRNRRTNE